MVVYKVRWPSLKHGLLTFPEWSEDASRKSQVPELWIPACGCLAWNTHWTYLISRILLWVGGPTKWKEKFQSWLKMMGIMSFIELRDKWGLLNKWGLLMGILALGRLAVFESRPVKKLPQYLQALQRPGLSHFAKELSNHFLRVLKLVAPRHPYLAVMDVMRNRLLRWQLSF